MEMFLSMVSLVVASGILVWVVYILIGEISAVSFVPTDQPEIDTILEKIKPGKNKLFLDLGSGDGRVVKTAVEKYGVRGIGYEIHPLLVWYSRVRSIGIPNIEYRISSLWNADLSLVDYIYCYLSPRAMKKLAEKIQKEGKKGVVIISKAFEAKDLLSVLKDKYQISGKNYFIYLISSDFPRERVSARR